MKHEKITERDLNDYDRLNGRGSIDTKNLSTNGMTGSLGQLGNSKIRGMYESTIFERKFIESQKNIIVEFRTEQFTYENLPEGLTKTRIEKKLVEHGEVAIIAIGGVYYAVSFMTKTWDMYNNPDEIIINEPKSKLLNGKKYSILDGDPVYTIRDNLYRQPIVDRAWRHIYTMERILHQIEKNITASAPKGLVNTGDIEFDASYNNAAADVFENIINSEDSFFAIKSKNIKNVGLNDEQKDPFTLMELTDRTDNLWKNYAKYKEELKGMVGADINANIGKMERTTNVEIEDQQGMTEATWSSAFICREEDYAELNKRMSINIIIKLVSDLDTGITRDEERDIILSSDDGQGAKEGIKDVKKTE